jgi:hypothetical protein
MIRVKSGTNNPLNNLSSANNFSREDVTLDQSNAKI